MQAPSRSQPGLVHTDEHDLERPRRLRRSAHIGMRADLRSKMLVSPHPLKTPCELNVEQQRISVSVRRICNESEAQECGRSKACIYVILVQPH